MAALDESTPIGAKLLGRNAAKHVPDRPGEGSRVGRHEYVTAGGGGDAVEGRRRDDHRSRRRHPLKDLVLYAAGDAERRHHGAGLGQMWPHVGHCPSDLHATQITQRAYLGGRGRADDAKDGVWAADMELGQVLPRDPSGPVDVLLVVLAAAHQLSGIVAPAGMRSEVVEVHAVRRHAELAGLRRMLPGEEPPLSIGDDDHCLCLSQDAAFEGGQPTRLARVHGAHGEYCRRRIGAPFLSIGVDEVDHQSRSGTHAADDVLGQRRRVDEDEVRPDLRQHPLGPPLQPGVTEARDAQRRTGEEPADHVGGPAHAPERRHTNVAAIQGGQVQVGRRRRIVGARAKPDIVADREMAQDVEGADLVALVGRERRPVRQKQDFRHNPPGSRHSMSSRSVVPAQCRRSRALPDRQRANMCGLAGLYDIKGSKPFDTALLARMTEVVAHRGPDGSGLHQEPGLGLGHRRLAVIDLVGGAQPMLTPDGQVTVVFNGEIYNFQELRAELQAGGARFTTHSDTEVLLHGWRRWGERLLPRLNGMFAFALWDRREQTLVLARDRFGKKPLHYALLDDGTLAFGSEIKSLLCVPQLSRGLDRQAVADFFAYGYVPDPKTIYRAIRKLPAAHLLIARRGQPVQLRAYWSLLDEPRRPDTASREALLDRLSDAVRRRLVADVPLGVLLSGGVDSSAIVALMADQGGSARTFSISFDEPDFDETALRPPRGRSLRRRSPGSPAGSR